MIKKALVSIVVLLLMITVALVTGCSKQATPTAPAGGSQNGMGGPTPVPYAMKNPSYAPATSPPGQSPIVAKSIDQFVEPLPKLDVAGGSIQTILAGTSQIELDMKEFKANMLPHTFVPASGGKYSGTWVWGYLKPGTNTSAARDTYTGPVVVATRGTPSEFKFVNNLGTTQPGQADTTHVQAYLSAIDQSLHWANPGGEPRFVKNPFTPATPEWLGNPNHYLGYIPAAVHLHGAEDPAALDGGPDSWFLGDGSNVGPGFYSKGWNGKTPQNYAIYRYPNGQEAAPIWFHDHTLGATRLNVYMGLAGGYLLTDPKLNLPAGLNATGLRAGALGKNAADDTVIPLVVQDRMFDQNGQLYFPAGPLDPVDPSTTPNSPYWNPEFISETPNVSDTITVNGKTWPYLNVKAQRYEFFLINGSNARSYILSFQDNGTTTVNKTHPTIWQIATDQGYLDKPAAVNRLVIMPGERAQFIVDFGGINAGTTLVLNNFGPDAPLNTVPVDPLEVADPATTGRVMQFRVVSGAPAKDTSFNPAAAGATVRAAGQQIVRLTDPTTGTLAKNVTPDLTRALTLNEIEGEPVTVNGVAWGGGPEIIVLNNTEWTGMQPDPLHPNDMTASVQAGFTPDGMGNFLSELPQEGATEVREIANLTADSHPIHTHLAQFQILNRQSLDVGTFTTAGAPGTGYLHAYESAFAGGAFKPEGGPPLAYAPSAASGGKYGGNPDITPFLNGPALPPDANEAGWKDTLRVPPGTVTRFVVRWAPTDITVQPNGFAALRYAFIPDDAIPGSKTNAHYDYVWHCHIVDHEDNEMMRGDQVIPDPKIPAAARSYQMGRDY